MRAFTALVQREYFEHRGAFFWAPVVLVGVLVLGTVLPFISGRLNVGMTEGFGGTLRFYEFAYLGLAAMWWLYLMGALFFYYADAFTADKRANSMLFWKSMPQTDLKILSSKMAAGLTLFPAIIFAVMVFCGLWSYVITLIADVSLPFFAAPPLGSVLQALVQLTLLIAAYLVLSLLWYAPFFAWVGGLSTLVGRWSIPLAFLLPALVALLENAVLSGPGPRGGYFLDFLRRRSEFAGDRDVFQELVASDQPLNAIPFIADLLTRVDWVSMIGGWAFVVVVLYAASEYRRRYIIT